MRWIYAGALVVGFVLLLVWVSWTSLAAGRTPDDRFGLGGRRIVAAVTVFGLAGMSASFGGWSTVLAVVGALVAAAAAAMYAGVVGVD